MAQSATLPISDNRRLIAVPLDSLKLAWPHCCAFLYEAMERGGLGSFRVVSEMVHDGRATLWLVASSKDVLGAGVTAIVTTEWRKVCEILAFGGDIESVRLVDGIEKYARTQGCSAVRLMGRKGWARVLKDYSAKHVLLEKELT